MKMLFWHLDSGPAQSRCRHHGSGRYQGKVKSSPNPFSGFKTWLLRVERYAGFLKQLPFPLHLSSIIMAILPQLLNIHLFWNDASLYPMHGAWEDHIVAFKVYPVTQMDKHWHYSQPSKVSSIIKLLVSMFCQFYWMIIPRMRCTVKQRNYLRPAGQFLGCWSFRSHFLSGAYTILSGIISEVVYCSHP